MSEQPEIGLTITRTANGNYRATIFERSGTAVLNVGLTNVIWQEVETFTSKKLPDFMWQLAKRIMPK